MKIVIEIDDETFQVTVVADPRNRFSLLNVWTKTDTDAVPRFDGSGLRIGHWINPTTDLEITAKVAGTPRRA